MLALLKNIRKSFIEAGSIRRYLLYALGEIFLVMIGILLAVQVNNWNQVRKNRALERDILKEINQEFTANLREFQGNLDRYDAVRQNLRAIIQSFPIDLNQNSLDTLGRQLDRIQFKGNYDGTAISISKLKNTSSFEIISSAELQSLLMQWEYMDADYRYDEERALLFHAEQFQPIMSTKLPHPYSAGMRDKRFNPTYLQSLEFEGLIRLKYDHVSNLFRILNFEPNLVTVMKQIVALSESETDQNE